jgi:hypothetical protein
LRESAITPQELELLRKLRSVPERVHVSVLRIVGELVNLAHPSLSGISEKDYQSDPIWSLAGRVSSGRVNDDSAINHDHHLYGANRD